MIIDTNQIEKMLNGETSAYEIEKQTGVSRVTINEIRKGSRKLDNVPLKNLKKLQVFINKEENEMKYEIKVSEFAEALKEFGGRFIIAYYEDGDVSFLHPEASPEALHTEEVDDEELLELSEDELRTFLAGNYESVNGERDYEVKVSR